MPKSSTKKVSSSELNKRLSTTKVFPDYIKDIYRAKLMSGEYSVYFVNRVNQIINELETIIKAK